MKIKQAKNNNITDWVVLRSNLWPDEKIDNLRKECLDLLESDLK